MAIYGRPLVPDAVLVGAALVPTSVSAVGQLLGGLGLLHSNVGPVVAMAALLDDAFALLLFDIFFSLGDEFHAFRMVGSPIIGSLLVSAGVAAAVLFWPKVLNGFLLPQIRRLGGEKGELFADQALYFVMFGILIFWAWILYMLGAFLWGCLIAGVSFACLETPEVVRGMWDHQTKRWATWLLRTFYACNVAFTIPAAMLFSGEAFWKGSLLGLGPCIVAKVVSALCVGEARFLIGWAMVSRGELAFFIAQASAMAGMMSNMSYCIVLWALLWAVVVTPYVLKLVPRSWEGAVTLAHIGKETRSVEDVPPLECLEGIDLEEYPQKSVEETKGDETNESSKGGLMCCLFFKDAMMR